MHIDSSYHRSFALVATALASALLLGNPFIGIAQTTPTPDRPSNPDKHLLLAHETQELAAAQAVPRPPKDSAKPPRVQAQAPQPRLRPEATTALAPLPRTSAGIGTIVQSGQAPFPGSLYTFENRWFEAHGDADLVVYAGAGQADLARGLVVVRVIGVTPGPASVYYTPIRAGSVHVIAAQGERLTLLSTTRVRFFFDVPSRVFGRS
jgi:hypothetical protein